MHPGKFRARRLSTALGLSLLTLLGLARIAFAQTDVSDWKPFAMASRSENSYSLAMNGAYRFTRVGGKFTKLELRLDRGSLDIDPSKKTVFAASKIQLVAGYRLPPPEKGMWLVPFHKDYAAPFREPSPHQVKRISETHYEFSGPVRTISLVGEDQDLNKYYAYAMVFTNAQGAYVPGVSSTFDLPPLPAGWIADGKTGCKVWNGSPEPGESIAWSGPCVGGLAEGRGALQWSRNGKPGDRYEGDLKAGKLDGRGVLALLDGSRYEGEFRNDDFEGQGVFRLADGSSYEGAWRKGKPNGHGTRKDAKGEVFAGNWTDGCFSEGGRQAVYATTLQACGFK